MAAMLAVMTVACGQNTAADSASAVSVETGAEASSQEERALETTLSSAAAVATGEAESGKVETVYVTADANGAVNDVIVSEWLKNADSVAELKDTTELHDIVNVKGSETFKDNGDGTLTWDAEGSDIYYQGTTDKELPVSMNVTYTLNGKEISPEELAGKSGRVTMKFSYENKDRQTVNVNGKDVEVYTPFAMVSGMMLDSEKFTNVEITNGKVVSDGGNYIVMGVAVPGLKESLDISDEKWDELEDADEIKERLSDSFEITADTTDFELGMTVTMASSDILSDFGLSDLSGSDKLEDLKGNMEDLNDGANKLVDGTNELKDGTSQFVDGTKKLYDGAIELNDGTKKLYDGTGTLLDGTGTLYDGTGKLLDGTGTLYDGTGSLADGIYKYTNGAAKINSGAKSLSDGAADLKSGTATLRKGMEDSKLVDSAAALATGAGQVSAGMDQLGEKVKGIGTAMAGLAELETMYRQVSLAQAYLTGATTEWNADVATGMYIVSGGQISDKATVDMIIAGANGAGSVTGALTQLKTMVENYDENVVEVSGGTLTKEDSEEVSESENNGADDSEKEVQVSEDAAPVNTSGEDTGDGAGSSDGQQTTANGSEAAGVEDSAAAKGSDDEVAGESAATGAKEVEEASQVVKSAKEELPAGSKVLTAEQYQTLLAYVTGLASGNTSVSNVMTAVGTYNQLLGSAQAILTTIGRVQEKVSGMSFDEKSIEELQQLIDGAKSVATGNAALSAGISGIYDGAVKLDNGAGKLSQGAKTLADGTGTLVSNNKELNDGASKLKDGAGQLKDGAAQLKDGAGQLKDGAVELKNGAGQLYDGTTELKDGTKELYDGAEKLDEGAAELLDGIMRFDDEGIKKLYEAFDGDLSEFTDRLTAIQEAGSTYKSFGGSPEDTDSSVKFIIRTDSIKSL